MGGFLGSMRTGSIPLLNRLIVVPWGGVKRIVRLFSGAHLARRVADATSKTRRASPPAKYGYINWFTGFLGYTRRDSYRTFIARANAPSPAAGSCRATPPKPFRPADAARVHPLPVHGDHHVSRRQPLHLQHRLHQRRRARRDRHFKARGIGGLQLVRADHLRIPAMVLVSRMIAPHAPQFRRDPQIGRRLVFLGQEGVAGMVGHQRHKFSVEVLPAVTVDRPPMPWAAEVKTGRQRTGLVDPPSIVAGIGRGDFEVEKPGTVHGGGQAMHAAFAVTYPELNALNIMRLATPQSAILSAVIFNAVIIVFLVPLALKGVRYRPASASQLLQDNFLIYGVGGLIVPFVGIKLIDMILVALRLV